jgi:hypothetical protein
VRNAGSGGGKEADPFVIEFHAVGVPHIGSEPS